MFALWVSREVNLSVLLSLWLRILGICLIGDFEVKRLHTSWPSSSPVYWVSSLPHCKCGIAIALISSQFLQSPRTHMENLGWVLDLSLEVPKKHLSFCESELFSWSLAPQSPETCGNCSFSRADFTPPCTVFRDILLLRVPGTRGTGKRRAGFSTLPWTVSKDLSFMLSLKMESELTSRAIWS